MLFRSLSLLIILIFSLPFGSAEARVWLLQADGTGDAPTIKAAIDSMDFQGDVIELADGTYTGQGNRDLNNAGKQFLIRSQNGDPATCIIDLQGSADDPHRFIVYAEDG